MEEYSLLDIAKTLVFPWVMMCQSLSYLPGTLLRLLREGKLAAALLGRVGGSHITLSEAWFSDFWTNGAAPGVRAMASINVVPLLAGRVHAGAVVADDDDAPAPHPPISGTVLEIGPGSGMWASVLARGVANSAAAAASVRHRSTSSPAPVKRILGVEPNAGVHAALAQATTEAGLKGVYEIVPAGIEDLAETGAVAYGEVDCIVSVLCLCSIPEPERNIRELYRYLKPGGRWYAYEHVRREPGTALYWYQAFVNLFWPHFIGGCRLRNETSKYLRSAGPWSDIDLEPRRGEPWFNTIPHIVGTLTK